MIRPPIIEGNYRYRWTNSRQEIITVIEPLNQLRESPEYELCQISEPTSGVRDERAIERTKRLESESSELEKQADRLAEEIKELNGPSAVGVS
ncbi:MAG: hypothetical protein WAO02_17880 [Verrucomicrobiia bacterium]